MDSLLSSPLQAPAGLVHGEGGGEIEDLDDELDLAQLPSRKRRSPFDDPGGSPRAPPAAQRLREQRKSLSSEEIEDDNSERTDSTLSLEARKKFANDVGQTLDLSPDDQTSLQEFAKVQFFLVYVKIYKLMSLQEPIVKQLIWIRAGQLQNLRLQQLVVAEPAESADKLITPDLIVSVECHKASNVTFYTNTDSNRRNHRYTAHDTKQIYGSARVAPPASLQSRASSCSIHGAQMLTSPHRPSFDRPR